MSLELIRSNGLEIKTWPSRYMGEDYALRIGRPDEDNLYFSLQRGLDEVEYTLHELTMKCGQDSVAIGGFKQYLASLTPKALKNPWGDTSFYEAAPEFAEYVIPELPDTGATDWCGVLINPTDFLHAARYILTNTGVEPDDIRTLFIQQLTSI